MPALLLLSADDAVDTVKDGIYPPTDGAVHHFIKTTENQTALFLWGANLDKYYINNINQNHFKRTKDEGKKLLFIMLNIIFCRLHINSDTNGKSTTFVKIFRPVCYSGHVCELMKV